MNAVVKIGGKQYYVTEGSEIYVEKVKNSAAGDKIVLDQVLMIDSKIGSPFIKNAKVEAEVVKNGKQRKIVIFKYKNKNKSSRKKQGHRQPYTKLKITKIVG